MYFFTTGLGGHGVVERCFHDVLQLDVESGDEVVAVAGIHVVFRFGLNPIAVVESAHLLVAILPA